MSWSIQTFGPFRNPEALAVDLGVHRRENGRVNTNRASALIAVRLSSVNPSLEVGIFDVGIPTLDQVEAGVDQ